MISATLNIEGHQVQTSLWLIGLEQMIPADKDFIGKYTDLRINS